MLEDIIGSEVLEEDPIVDGSASELIEEDPIIDGSVYEFAEEDPIIDGSASELIEEDPIPEGSASELVEEDPSGEELADELTEVTNDQNISSDTETDAQTNEEEVLLNLEKIAMSAEVTQTNVKTGIENLQMLSTCSIGLNALLFGGFVIFCFLNRLG